MKIFLHTIFPSLSFPLARLAIFLSEPKPLCDRSRILFFTYLTGHKINETLAITVKTMIDFKSFLGHMARKLIVLFNIFTYLATRSIKLKGTSISFERIMFRTNQMAPEVTCCSKRYKRNWCKY